MSLKARFYVHKQIYFLKHIDIRTFKEKFGNTDIKSLKY